MSMKRLVVFVVLVLVPSVVFAGIDGKVSGTVIDAETNSPLAGTNVIIVGTQMGASTDAEGKYIIFNVPIGTYEVRATFIGYASVTVENVKVNSDLTTNLDFEMPTTDVAGEAVVIVAEEPLVNLTATSVVRSVPAELLRNLATRSGLTFFGLQAGVVIHNRAVFIRGGRSDETGFQIEGVTSGAAVGSTGGASVTVIPQALAEVKILVGGFSADVGGGAAGIVQQSFKTGTSSMHGSIAYETDGPADSFGETFSYGYNDLTATLSGPLGGLKYFVAYRKRQDDDNSPQFFKGFDFGYLKDTGADGGTKGDSAHVKWDDGKVPGRNHDEWILNGNLQYDLNPLVLRFSGAFSTHERRLSSSPIRDIFNLGRLAKRDDENSLYILKAGYFLSDKTVINASISRSTLDQFTYDPNFITDGVFDMAKQLDSGDGDRVAEVNADWAYDSRFVNPNYYNFAGFRFDRPGRLQTGYFKREQTYTDISAGIITQYGSHEIRAGASLRSGVIRQFGLGAGLTISLNSQIGVDPTLRDELINGTDRARLAIRRGSGGGYGYDEFGNEVNEGPDDAKRPVFTAFYVNDKIEFSDIIVNVGVRVDQFDLDTWHLADSADPNYDKTNSILNLSEKAKSTTEVQPRFGLAFPISERMVFHLQYGKFASFPDLINAYKGRPAMAFALGGAVFIPSPVGFDLEPIVSTQYEIGFNYQFTDQASFDLTAYYKTTEGQLTIDRYKINPGQDGGDYNVFINGDFNVTRGFEFTLRTRRVGRIQTLINYTLGFAKGTNSFPNSRLSSTERDIRPPKYITPLRFEQRHRGSLILDYRFIGDDEGPGRLFANSGVNALINFNSGHTFTLATGSGAQRRAERGALLNDRDPRSRVPSEPIGGSTTPWTFTTDLKLSKDFDLGNLNAGVYVFISNVFNRRNVLNVYNRTGDAYDDGFLTNPELSEKIVAGLEEEFVPLYRAINLENRQHWIDDRGVARDLFNTPREIRIGVKLDF